MTLIFILSGTQVSSQNWIRQSQFETPSKITSASVDANDNFYIGLESGSLIRFLKDGTEDQYFSLANNSAITMVEAWNRLKVYCFYQDQQKVEILDRFTTTPKTLEISSFESSFVSLVAPGVDNSFWVLTNGQRELKKYDDQNLNLILNFPLPGSFGLSAPTYMRAYKNVIIIADKEAGLFFLDQFGNFLGSIPELRVQAFQIHENQLITLSGGMVYRVDPFSLEVIEKIKAPTNVGAFRSVVMSGDMFVFISENKFEIYSLE